LQTRRQVNTLVNHGPFPGDDLASFNLAVSRAAPRRP
jgi:hypothetical protein